jgi:predicted NACHT family NTPase
MLPRPCAVRVLKTLLGGPRRHMAMLTAPEIDSLLKKAKARSKEQHEARGAKRNRAVPKHQRQRVPGAAGARKTAEQQRSQNVAVLGAPNAGKSTLLNKILGTKAPHHLYPTRTPLFLAFFRMVVLPPGRHPAPALLR